MKVFGGVVARAAALLFLLSVSHSFLNSLERGSGSILEASSKHLSCAQLQEGRLDRVRDVEQRPEGR